MSEELALLDAAPAAIATRRLALMNAIDTAETARKQAADARAAADGRAVGNDAADLAFPGMTVTPIIPGIKMVPFASTTIVLPSCAAELRSGPTDAIVLPR